MNKLKLREIIGKKYRNQRTKIFLKTFSLNKQSKLKILDLGGHPGLSCLELFYNCEVVYQNLYSSIKFDNLPENHRYICQDATNIPFSDKYFDIVYSNSVIEHIGTFAKQIKMAEEIERVGKKYWIQTPYKHFPIEPHYNFPFFQYLPNFSKTMIFKYWPYSYYNTYGGNYEDILLLNIAQLKKLFPNASSFYFEKFGFLIKSIVAIKN